MQAICACFRPFREDVLRYVVQDTRTTLNLATASEACGALPWGTRTGKVRTMALPGGWLAVEAACQLPLPDTSSMDVP
jgi:hypothetical protein